MHCGVLDRGLRREIVEIGRWSCESRDTSESRRVDTGGSLVCFLRCGGVERRLLATASSGGMDRFAVHAATEVSVVRHFVIA